MWAAFYAKEEENAWVIDSGSSNHMTSDKGRFINLKECNGEAIRFVGDHLVQICEKGAISIDGKNKVENVFYVKGPKHNLLSVI